MKRLTTIFALLLSTVGAWAKDLYNVYFYSPYPDIYGATVIEHITLPRTLSQAELTKVMAELKHNEDPNYLFTGNFNSSGDGKVVCENSEITINEAFSGSLPISIEYFMELVKTDPMTVEFTPGETPDTWLFEMTASDILLTPDLYYCLDEEATEADNETNYGAKTDVFLKRTLKTGGWNTFAAPFAISTPTAVFGEGVKVKQLMNSTLVDGVLTLTFADATSMAAGTPYLVKVADEVAEPIFDDVDQNYTLNTVSAGVVNFVPTLGKALVQGDGDNVNNAQTVLYLGGGNKLYHPTVVNKTANEDSYMKGFRAYFQLKGEAAQSARSFTIDLGDSEPTGIKLIGNKSMVVEETDGATYSLDGRQFNSKPRQKGIYIQQGKKLVIY